MHQKKAGAWSPGSVFMLDYWSTRPILLLRRCALSRAARKFVAAASEGRKLYHDILADPRKVLCPRITFFNEPLRFDDDRG
jgi:hypothetical protein